MRGRAPLIALSRKRTPGVDADGSLYVDPADGRVRLICTAQRTPITQHEPPASAGPGRRAADGPGGAGVGQPLLAHRRTDTPGAGGPSLGERGVPAPLRTPVETGGDAVIAPESGSAQPSFRECGGVGEGDVCTSVLGPKAFRAVAWVHPIGRFGPLPIPVNHMIKGQYYPSCGPRHDLAGPVVFRPCLLESGRQGQGAMILYL